MDQRVKDSYSEDLEDVICSRLVDETTPARHLDIGANHPVENSVTYFFYRRGWRGVAVDPLPQFAHLWANHRTEDVLLNAAIGAAGSPECVMDFFEYEPSVLSTGDPDRHQQLLADPAARHVATHAVPLMTAAQVIEAHPEMYRGGSAFSLWMSREESSTSSRDWTSNASGQRSPAWRSAVSPDTAECFTRRVFACSRHVTTC